MKNVSLSARNCKRSFASGAGEDLAGQAPAVEDLAVEDHDRGCQSPR